MIFVFPTFLWALLAVSIPVIIHLFNFRRYKKVYFSNVRFLKELQHESKSKSRLKEILILIARCFTIACLVFAFSQPLLTDKENRNLTTGNKVVSIYIDNSFSMENVEQQGPLLEIAKKHAAEIVKVFGGADKFQIITNDFEGRHQRYYSKEDVFTKIEEIKISPAVKSYADIFKRQCEFLGESKLQHKKIFALSDLQKSTFNFNEIKNDTNVEAGIIPLPGKRINNVYIDTCWFETPIQQKGFIQKLHAIIINKGSNTINAGSAKLFLNKQQLAIASYSLEPDSKKEIQFSFECKQNGFNYGSVKIEDYPVTFDDEMFFAFNSKINIRVCLINGTNTGALNAENPFESLLKSDSLFNLFSYKEQSIDYSKFKISDAIILNQLTEISSGLISQLTEFAKRGGSVMIIPALNCNKEEYNSLFSVFQLPLFAELDTISVKTDKIESAHGFFAGVFEKTEERLNLPIVNKHFKLVQNTKSNFESLILLQNADVLLGNNKYYDGNFYLFTIPFTKSSTNFFKHALFVPTIYRFCFGSLKSAMLMYTINTNNIISLKSDNSGKEDLAHIRALNNKTDIIPEVSNINNSLMLQTHAQINLPGFYEITKANIALFPLAFNYSRKESDLNCFRAEELESGFEKLGFKNFKILENSSEKISSQIMESEGGKKLWKMFIILSLGFIIIEITLLRFLK